MVCHERKKEKRKKERNDFTNQYMRNQIFRNYFTKEIFWNLFYDWNVFTAMSLIVSLLFFHTDDFGIRQPTKIEMPLNKETKERNVFDIIYDWNVLEIILL